jgi:uncharacterized protein YggE
VQRTLIVLLGLISSSAAMAAETPAHSIAVTGKAELLLRPDYATAELGVVTQSASVSDALAENGARMKRVIDSIKSLGVSAKDIQTSTFTIQPKYEKTAQPDYGNEEFKAIVGYYVENKVTVDVRDISRVAKVIDESVKAGANASGRVTFQVDAPSSHLDDARKMAIENAYHNAQVLTDAAHLTLG